MGIFETNNCYNCGARRWAPHFRHWCRTHKRFVKKPWASCSDHKDMMKKTHIVTAGQRRRIKGG